MGKKFNNIKPGTICTLIHNDALVFRIIHINDVGYPFAMHSMWMNEFQIDEKPICMAYTTEYKEATKEQVEKFIALEKKFTMKENYDVMERIKDVNITNFKNALYNGVVEFKYTKKNGEIRTAKGTLNIDIMGEDNAPKGTGYDIVDTNIRYYDLNSEGWRSFITENLIEWNKIN